MSFAKAKIRRFNDITSSTPPPGTYDPNLKERPAGSFISSNERFKQPRSPTRSDASSAPSFNSCTTPSNHVFAIPKKPKSCTKQKPLSLFKEDGDLEALKERIVECNNKDLFIKELTEQIEEMKMKLNQLEKDNKKLSTEYTDEINQLKNQQEGTVTIQKKQLLEIIKTVRSLKIELEEIKDFKQQLKKTNREDLLKLSNYFGHVQTLFKKTYDDCNVVIKTNEEEIKNLKDELDEQKKVFADVKLSLADKLEETEKQHQIEINKLKQENEAKIKQLEENFKEVNLLGEMQMKELEESWKTKFEAQEKEAEAILKECQAISEYNIIQCELEKNNIKVKLAEKEVQYENMEEKMKKIEVEHKELQSKLSEIIIELNETRQKLGEEIANHQETVQQTSSKKHTYELTISKIHETIEALKIRLFNSDRDVEQMKLELETSEAEKLEMESKCNQLKNEIDDLKKQNEDLEMQYESTFKQMKEKIQKSEMELIVKVEEFHVKSKENVNILTDKLVTSEKNFMDVMEQLHEQQRLNLEAQSLITKSNLEIERFEASNIDLKYEIKRLEATTIDLEKEISKLKMQVIEKDEENKTIQETVGLIKTQLTTLQADSDVYKTKMYDYKKELEETADVIKKYIELSGKFDQLLQSNTKLEEKCAKLEKKLQEEEALVGPFRKQLEAYEAEYKLLMSQKACAEKEAKEMGQKYAEMLGHQNCKQKIKHVIDLKNKNQELIQTNQLLESKISSQARKIDKLKKEVAALSKPIKTTKKTIEDKENLNNSGTVQIDLVDSPGPLRNRN